MYRYKIQNCSYQFEMNNQMVFQKNQYTFKFRKHWLNWGGGGDLGGLRPAIFFFLII